MSTGRHGQVTGAVAHRASSAKSELTGKSEERPAGCWKEGLTTDTANTEEVLNAPVLVLNRVWQAIATSTVKVAFCDMVRESATAIDTDTMSPVRTEDWFALPVRPGDKFLCMTRGRTVRVPSVISRVGYDKMPTKPPRLDKKNLVERDHYTCQYCGRVHRYDALNMDHVRPRSKGGNKKWTNIVASCIPCNSKKADRTPTEAGMRLVKAPKEPIRRPVIATMKRRQDRPEWDMFLFNH
jgi:5-methylcytosine-specific restriction endonuclease McrA